MNVWTTPGKDKNEKRAKLIEKVYESLLSLNEENLSLKGCRVYIYKTCIRLLSIAL